MGGREASGGAEPPVQVEGWSEGIFIARQKISVELRRRRLNPLVNATAHAAVGEQHVHGLRVTATMRAANRLRSVSGRGELCDEARSKGHAGRSPVIDKCLVIWFSRGGWGIDTGDPVAFNRCGKCAGVQRRDQVFKRPPFSLHVEEGEKMRRFGVLLAFVGLAFGASVQAELVLYEPFEYGETEQSLVGLGGSQTGFSSGNKWGSSGATPTYQVVGLTMGSGTTQLVVSGGLAAIVSGSNSSRTSRRISVDQTGQIWGSYLWSHTSGTSYSGLGISSQTTGNENAGIDFLSLGKIHNSTTAGIRIGTGATTSASTNATGTAYTTGTTNLVLFTVTGLGNGTAQSQSMQQWMLTSNQFDYFKNLGLTATNLNAASTGTAASNVLNRASLTTASGTAGMTSLDYLIFAQNPANANARVDEIRISNVSLDEVTPVVVPEPHAIALLLAGLGLVAARRRQLNLRAG
mgnify:CR=1 FL=1